jgi:hypothetical protein
LLYLAKKVYDLRHFDVSDDRNKVCTHQFFLVF